MSRSRKFVGTLRAAGLPEAAEWAKWLMYRYDRVYGYDHQYTLLFDSDAVAARTASLRRSSR